RAEGRAPDGGRWRDDGGGPRARSRLDGGGPRGARALATQPVQRGRQLTLRGAWSRQGLGAAMPGAGGTDGEVLRAFWRAGLGPQRRPGQVRRMAHRKAHPGSGVADRWATAGGRLLALPPSAPALAPIAASGSKVKPRMRAQAARTLAAWEQAIAAARAAVTSQEAQGWFAHAGYCIATTFMSTLGYPRRRSCCGSMASDYGQCWTRWSWRNTTATTTDVHAKSPIFVMASFTPPA